jgi:hypothetical protein
MTEQIDLPPRVEHLGVTLAWAPYPEWPLYEPRYPLHNGRVVWWEEWEIALTLSHVTFECETCAYDGQPWWARGKVDALPGERFRGTTFKFTKSGHLFHGDYDVPAYAIWQLSAYLCPACDDMRIYDRGRAGRDFIEINVEEIPS